MKRRDAVVMAVGGALLAAGLVATLTIDSEPSRPVEDELPSLDRPELPEGAPAAGPYLPVTTVMEGLALNPEVPRSVVYVSTDSISFDDTLLGRFDGVPAAPVLEALEDRLRRTRNSGAVAVHAHRDLSYRALHAVLATIASNHRLLYLALSREGSLIYSEANFDVHEDEDDVRLLNTSLLLARGSASVLGVPESALRECELVLGFPEDVTTGGAPRVGRAPHVPDADRRRAPLAVRVRRRIALAARDGDRSGAEGAAASRPERRIVHPPRRRSRDRARARAARFEMPSLSPLAAFVALVAVVAEHLHDRRIETSVVARAPSVSQS